MAPEVVEAFYGGLSWVGWALLLGALPLLPLKPGKEVRTMGSKVMKTAVAVWVAVMAAAIVYEYVALRAAPEAGEETPS